MTTDYEAICKENRESYGTKGAQKSGKLAAGLYDDRTHFIFELLQNAEDALGRRGEWDGSREVSFTLSPTHLILSHFGKPFDEADVRSVCDIAESTKNESSIGRFGLGFKSVYTVTDLPEIHSGDEDFAIENYVFPKRLVRSAREDGETQIILPLKPEDASVTSDITAGFRHLGPGTLLFLRHIDKINWRIEDGPSGSYLRNSPETLGPNVQHITVIGKEDDRPEVDQNWLVFHRDVFSAEGHKIGRVEIAFSLVAAKDAPGRWAVQPLAKSPLVVFFPTVVESHLGFLVQGPYRTTPSRDNVPPGDPWNLHLVKETSGLLVEALCCMRNNGMLDVTALRCLPLDREKFPKGSRFAPMFDTVRQAFQDERLLPTFDRGHVTANQAKLARAQDLRELFSPEQLALIFGVEMVAWLSDNITEAKTPEIRKYLMRELNIDEIRPERIMPILSKAFLEAQPDEWILRLYEFLSRQGIIVRVQLNAIPLVRLENGSHVVACKNGKAQAFLPSAVATSLPTVRRAVCPTPEVCLFLSSLGVTEPDLVDDVICNILPKYQQTTVSLANYAEDIERIHQTFVGTDSSAQRDKLLFELRKTSFVVIIHAGDGKRYVDKPRGIYIATERLKRLFAGVAGINIVDDAFGCLRDEDICDLLVSCGASRYLMPQAIRSELTEAEKKQIRREAGLECAKKESQPEDFTLRGLTQLLKFLHTLKPAEAQARAQVLWDALTDLESHNTDAFYGSYKWSYSHTTKTARFDAAFVRELNQAAWVPNAAGELVPPGLVEFDTLRWKPNAFLQTKIIFKPPIIDQLAKAAGIDPALLDLLRRDPAIVAELTSRLSTNQTPEPEPAPEQSDGDVYDGAKDLYDDDMPDIPSGTLDPDGGNDVGTGVGAGCRGQGLSGTGMSRGTGQGKGGTHGGSSDHGTTGGKDSGSERGQGKRTPGHAGGRPFISYVGTHPDDDGSDPDGLDQAARMQIEARAIDLIISLEPTLRRTPEGNPGFDLFEADSSDKQIIRWVEVKSMTGTLEDRPVGLSRTQFEFAREKGDAYWLYVVEHATGPAQARVLRIQNPVSHARTFTFDKGWREIARELHLQP